MTEYIVKSDDSEWYVYISKNEGWSLTGCAEIAHKFGDIEAAEKMADEINHNNLFKSYHMSAVAVPDRRKRIKYETYNDHFENAKRYNIPKAQLIISDIPYNLGKNAYASSSAWYVNGDNKNGESDKANKEFFDTDKDFKIGNFFDFAARLLKPESKEKTGKTGQTAPCMVVFCAFNQQAMVIEEGRKHGFNNYINLVFRKKSSPQVLKANMKIVGNCEYAIVLYRNRLPKFNNHGKMIMNCMDVTIGNPDDYYLDFWKYGGWCIEWEKDDDSVPKIHPTQKPVSLLKKLVELFTDVGDVVIDPCCGSGSTIRAAYELGRSAYGFEIKKDFYQQQPQLFEGMKMQVSLEDSDKIKAGDTEMQLELF